MIQSPGENIYDADRTKRFTQQPPATPFADGQESSNVGSATDASIPVAVGELIVRPFDTSNPMSDASPPFWIQALGTLGALVLVVGFVAWEMRRNRNEFRLSRVLGIAFASLLASIPFVAAFWWISPSDVDRHSPWLLAAVFVPVFILEAGGISIMIRRRRQRFHEHTTA